MANEMNKKTKDSDETKTIRDAFYAIDDYLKIGGSNERHRLWIQKEILRVKLIVDYDQTLEKGKEGNR